MDTQTWIVLALVALAAGYFLRDFTRSLATGGCASGCGSCASQTCGLRKLAARRKVKAARPV